VGRLIAYHHNNPVDAGLVGRARESTWTSHQAYLDLVAPPKWLDVELGLDLCGFSNTPLGREQFDRFVLDAQTLPPDPLIEGGDLRRARCELRNRLGSAVEMSYPSVNLQQGTSSSVAVIPREAVLQPRSTTTAMEIVDIVAKRTSVSTHEMCSRSRVRSVVHARRLVVVVGRLLGLSLTELAGSVGISAQSAGQLERSADPCDIEMARELALEVERWAPVKIRES
jgi:hypothetical protein